MVSGSRVPLEVLIGTRVLVCTEPHLLRIPGYENERARGVVGGEEARIGQEVALADARGVARVVRPHHHLVGNNPLGLCFGNTWKYPNSHMEYAGQLKRLL